MDEGFVTVKKWSELVCNLNGTNLLIKKAHRRGGVKTN